jgi:MFS family permease
MKTSPTSRYLVTLIVLLMLVSIVNVADKELLAPVVDAVKLDLGMTDSQVAAVRSAVFLTALLGQFFWGPLSDRWVRKYIITLGTLIWSAVTWITAFVTSFPSLLLARASMSFAEGCFNPSAYALITDAMPKKRQGLVLGLMGLTYPLGTAAALVIASLIGTEHWRKPFLYYGVIGLGLGILVFLIVREPKRGANEEAVQERQGEYGGRFSLAEFRKFLAVPTVLLAFGLDSCQSIVNWSLAFWAPTYMTRYHIAPDADTAALALLPAIVGFVVGALVGGWSTDLLRHRIPLAPIWIGLVSMTGGLGMALIVFNTFQLGPMMVAAFFLGVITYMVMPTVTVIQFSVVPPENKASIISSSNIILNLFISILTFLIGVVSDAAGLRLAFGGVTVCVYAIGIVICLFLMRTYPRDVARRNQIVESNVISQSLEVTK